MALLITFSEQQEIKPIASNSEDRFAQIMEETQINELQDLLGFQLYQDLTQNPTDSKYVTLLDGTTFTYCNQTIEMQGLKTVLAHYFFANYTRENGLQDTFSGHRIHQFPESNPINDVDKKKIESRARETAYKFWREVELYLNENRTTYEYWRCGPARKVFAPKIKRSSRPIMSTDFKFDTLASSKRHISKDNCGCIE